MSSRPEPAALPSPTLFFDTVTAFQRTAAIKAAIELDLFGAVGDDGATATAVASRIGAPERSARILCDYLAATGFLTKDDGRYGLTPSSAMFLDRRSRAYCGGAIGFLLSPALTSAFADLAETVRRGTTQLNGEGTVSKENPVWLDFARCMAPLMTLPAELMAGLLPLPAGRKARVLDIAAGHGAFGIAIAQRNPDVEVTALDWASVLEVARENARAAGVADRYHVLAGDAFEVDFCGGYDIVLLTNFLHHFDVPACESLLRKVSACLNPDGRAATLEFVLNDDRLSPPSAAGFPLVMLATTPGGDAYTFADYERMFANAGFRRSELHDLGPAPERLVISHK
ncbi:MAG: methyltransferase domain-containing protein [Bryobacteraceae bacterium]|nr:methyltransferase domain-containing protein [Bryobacteraceae bacterium]